MSDREELLRRALEEFIDKLPNKINNQEIAWIIFNIIGSREKLEDWGKISKLTVVNIAEYFLHQAFSPEELSTEFSEEDFESAKKDADNFLRNIFNDL